MVSYINKLFITLSGVLLLHSVAQAVTINFNSLTGMSNLPGSPVPVASRLTDAFLATDGVTFTSAAGYVAVVDHSPDPTVSPPNVIGGVTASGLLSYGTPIEFSFFDPSNSAIKGVTGSVSIRGDQAPLQGATATMEAFDVSGNSLGSVSDNDSATGLTLSLSIPGIHSVRLTQNSAVSGLDGTIGFDNLSFDTVSAVPVPAAIWLFGTGLVGLIGVARRRKS